MKAGDAVLRHVQHYLAGALNEEAGDAFVLAVARAIDRGAKTPAEALGVIFHAYLHATAAPAKRGDKEAAQGELLRVAKVVTESPPSAGASAIRDHGRGA